MARTAVVAGTATAVSGSMSRNAQRRQVEQQQAAAYREGEAQQAAPAPPATDPAPPAGSSEDPLISKLRELAALKEAGVLSDDEFTAAKAKLLA